jgi:lambda family phage minor tail protein L
MTVPVAELQSIAPSSIIELFVLELNTTMHGVSDIYRFHAGVNAVGNGGNVVWAGNTYQAMPIEAEGFEYSGNGQLPRPKIRVANIMGTITALILSLPSGLEGAKVSRIRTLARYLDAVNFSGGTNPYGTPDSTAEMPREVFYIDRKSAETRDVVEYEMCAAFDLIGVRAPKRQCIANICQWVYRSTECSYSKAGYYDTNNTPVASLALDVCGKRLDSCQTRFSVYTRTGTVTVGSNVWTTASTTSILPGEPIRGWGLPTGTTVSTVASSTTLTLSANATASSSASTTATPSATAATLTVTSATGLGVGMTVAGTYMNGSTITGISGTTLTLSQRPYSFSRSGTYDVTPGYFYLNPPDVVKLTNTTGIVVGMRVFGSLGINTTVAAVSAGVSITLTTAPATPKDGAAVTVYFMPASPAAATYTFTADTSYAFRDPASELPFGSFPGVGSYTS